MAAVTKGQAVRRAGWFGVFSLLLLGGAASCGKSERARGRDGANGGAANRGGSTAAGSSNRGGSSRGGSNGGTGVSGDAGESGTGGASGGTRGGDGGSAGGGDGGAGPDPTCDAPCTASNCCSDVRGLVCSNPSMAEVVVVAAAASALPANVTLVGEAVLVTFCSSTASDVTLTFDASGRDPENVLVVRVEESGKLTALGVTADDDSLTVSVSTSGTYAALELRPPDNCNPATRRGSVAAISNADLTELGGITRLDGDLTIGGAVSNLDALACLTWISGNLTVSGTTALAELELDALASVGGAISMNNDSLERVSFPGLLFVGSTDDGESIVFQDQGKITSIDVPNLMETEGALRLQDLGQETDGPLVLNLSSLETVGGSLYLSNLEDLVDLDGLASLRELGGLLSVIGNHRLVQADGLAGVETLGMYVDFTGNYLLESVDLRSLRTLGPVDGSLSFTNLPVLTELDVRSVVDVPGDLRLSGLATQASAPLALHFESLETVGTSLRLNSVDNVATLDAFQGLKSISRDAVISGLDHTEMLRLTGLEEAGVISIGGNPLLRSIDLRSLNTVSNSLVDDAIVFDALPRLESIDLRALGEVGGYFALRNGGEEASGPLILNLSAAASLGALEIDNVENLENFSGFAALEVIRRWFTLTACSSVTDLRGLAGLTSIGESIQITNNAVLPTCEAWWLRDHVPAPTTVVISDNLADMCQ